MTIQNCSSRSKHNTTIKIVMFCFLILFLNLSIPIAKQQDEKIAETEATPSDTAAIYNTLGNAILLKLQPGNINAAKLDTAIMYYQKAIELDPDDGGIKLNLAITYLVKGDTTTADSCFVVALAQCDSSLSKTYYLLGIKEETEEGRGTSKNVTKNKLKERLNEASKKLSSKKTKPGKDTKKKPVLAPPGGPKQLDPQEAKEYLYWKY